MSKASYNDAAQDFTWMQDFYKEQQRRDQSARLIIAAYEDFLMSGHTTGYSQYLEDEYGIRLNPSEFQTYNSTPGGHYEVIDEVKHTLFLLKYAGKS